MYKIYHETRSEFEIGLYINICTCTSSWMFNKLGRERNWAHKAGTYFQIIYTLSAYPQYPMIGALFSAWIAVVLCLFFVKLVDFSHFIQFVRILEAHIAGITLHVMAIGRFFLRIACGKRNLKTLWDACWPQVKIE